MADESPTISDARAPDDAAQDVLPDLVRAKDKALGGLILDRSGDRARENR